MRNFGDSLAWGALYWALFCLWIVGAAFTWMVLSEPIEPAFLLHDLINVPLATLFWAALAAISYGVVGVPFFALIVFVVKKVRKRHKAKRAAQEP